jgi:hypothetical protein
MLLSGSKLVSEQQDAIQKAITEEEYQHQEAK